jgi:uncharacterized membrane protein YfcA
MEIDLLTLILLFFVGGFSGFVDSIAGGGGIIALPALLAVGIPPHQALATNKFQGSFGSLTAAVNYSRKGMMRPRELMLGVLFTFVGAASGTLLVQYFPADALESTIVVMLIVIFVYTLLSPELGKISKHAVMGEKLFYLCFGLLLGFYDGFFGPGTGSFWTMALILMLGLDLKKATAQTKVFNFTSNVVSLVLFVYAGLVIWTIGLVMAVGQILGAYIGSTMVSKREVKFIRVFFLIVVGATILKLVFG